MTTCTHTVLFFMYHKCFFSNSFYYPFSYTLLDSDLSIVLGHSDDVATLKAIQTIVHSMSAVKQAEDPAIKFSYLSSE